MAIIKTPDQRVRVFISSTINELADERKAARAAIENLRLIPVFFEAGARPHPPRDLYSAYLDQSHIFLGIYWNSYGWVAPGAEISGLEDEYRLCGNKKTKLIYVKKSAERQPRLNDLLADIEKSDTACYQTFSDAAELQKLIENDLSVLMSEIFENALFDNRQQKLPSEEITQITHHKLVELPLIKSEIYGRDEDLQKVSELLLKSGVSLITLLGAGGTGKTTLSVHLGHQLKENFKDGVAFIPLAPVTDYKLVGATIAEIIGVNDSGKQPIEQTLIEFFLDKNFLLILDNFEQVVEASKFISDIITRCRDVKILVTSRTSLHIRNERIYNLNTLALPDENKTITPEELRNFPATELFVERALEVNPRMQFSKENTEAIIEICQRMDGLPLAIELAAARTRFFQPAALMSRIEKTLDFVSKGHKDLPERQQTLRGAIEWSYNLLAEDTQKVFRQLGVFKRSWTMEAADIILNSGNNSVDVEEMMERLLDVSLIKPVLVSHSAEPRFNMLQTVHEYAAEMLDKSAEVEETKQRYADYFLQLLEQSEGQTWGINSEPWLDKIEYEYQNIRAAFHFFVANNQYEKAWKFFYLLAAYWSIRGGLSEATAWVKEAKLDVDETTDENIRKIDYGIKAKALAWAGYCQLYMVQIQQGMDSLKKAKEYAEKVGDTNTLGLALTMYAAYGAYLGYSDVPQVLERAKQLIEQSNDPIVRAFFYTWTFEYYSKAGDFETMNKHIELSREIGITHDIKMLMGYFMILHFHIPEEEMKADELFKISIDTYNQFPAKGYKAFKSAAMNGCALAELMKKNFDSAWNYIIKAIEYARESGEVESKFWGVLSACSVFSLTEKFEKAAYLLGCLDNFFEETQYPVAGSGVWVLANARKATMPEGYDAQRKGWYETGKKMKLEEALIYALKK